MPQSSTQPAPDLKTALYNAVAYFDLFTFAPTLLEIEKWLLHYGASQKPSLHTILTTLTQDARITEQDGHFVLNGREELAALRKIKYDLTDEKWKQAKRYLRLLSALPFVEAIWFANSMGWGNPNNKSDIDLLIVAKPKQIWTARFFTTALMKLFRQRPHEQAKEKALCLSLYLSAEQYDIESHKLPEDIHYAFWATQFYPLYDGNNSAFKQYQTDNQWLAEYFANLQWTVPIKKRQIHLSTIERTLKHAAEILFSPFEQFFKRFQLRIMPDTLKNQAADGNTVVLTDSILKLHTNDNRADIQQQWSERINTEV